MDTGIGIPKDKIQTIFDMFQQVDSSVTRKFNGVGLGLYIVRKFTALLDGSVAVQSETGKGSVFTVTLPLKQKAHERDNPESQSFASTARLH
jgi:signal transduction histidine kinase